MDKFSINSSTKFTVLEELNSEFTLVKIKVMATGKNRNMSYFSRDVVEAHLNSLNYAPVVAHLFKDENGEYRIGGHDMYIDWEDWSIKSLCVPFGVVKADTFEWETINEYGTDVEYLTCEAILWTGRYPELKETIYSDEVWWNQSMEVNCAQYRPLEEDSNFIEVLDFEFSALCLLYKSDNREENVEPCFISADVTPINFSADDFAIKMNEMKQAMSEVFAFGDEEGENMDENKEIVNESEETEVTEGTEPEAFSNENESEATDPETTTNSAEEAPVDYEALYNDSLVAIDALTIKNAEYEARIADLNSQIEILTPFKIAAEKAEREKAENEIFSKYDGRIGEMPEYNELKAKSNDYDLEQLDKECMILVGKFAMSTFALNDNKSTKTESIKFSVGATPTKVSPYGDIFERYGNND
jgi:hypothetical protein